MIIPTPSQSILLKITMTVRIDELFKVRERYLLKYKQLRVNFLQISSLHLDFTALNELRSLYDHVVDSRRESERIRDLEGILKILEKRAVLSYDSISPIEQIAAKFIKDRRFDQEIYRYLAQLTPQLIQDPLGSFNVFKYQSVFENVSENLGRNWMDVARFFSINEGEIDTIQRNCNLGMKQKAMEVFRIFESRCEHSEWQTQFISALKKARRQDLIEAVEHLMSENNS